MAEEIEIIIEETIEQFDVLIEDNGEVFEISINEGISSHSELNLDDGTNPHGTTKSDVGLGNVPNLDTTNAVNNEHTHSNKSTLDLITEAFTTALKTSYDSVVNGYNNLIATGVRLITSGEITKLSNTSGTNTGDETTSSIQTKRPLKTVDGKSLEGVGDVKSKKSYSHVVFGNSISFAVLNTWYGLATNFGFGVTNYGIGATPSGTFNTSGGYLPILKGYKLVGVQFGIHLKSGASASTTTQVYVQVVGTIGENTGNTGSTIYQTCNTSAIAPWSTTNAKYMKDLTVSDYTLAEEYSYLQFAVRETQQTNTLSMSLTFNFEEI